MSKSEVLLSTSTAPWRPSPSPGVRELILAHSDGDAAIVTRLLHLEAGAHTRAQGVVVHDFWEEVYVLEGSLHDIPSRTDVTAGSFACRPPGTPHGPIESDGGCTLLEVRYR